MRSKWTSVALATALSVTAVGAGAGAATAFVDDRSPARATAPAPAAEAAVPDAAQVIGKAGDLGGLLQLVSELVTGASAEKPDADALTAKLKDVTAQADKVVKSLGGGTLPVSTDSVVPAGVTQVQDGKALPLPGLSLEDAIAALKKDLDALVKAATTVPPDLEAVKNAVTTVATDVLAVLTAAVAKLAPPV
jgi:hypothetical protein